MKNLILKFLIIGVILSSCSNKENKATVKSTNSVETSKVETVLQNYMKAWAEHNVTKIGGFFDEEVQWYDLPSDEQPKENLK